MQPDRGAACSYVDTWFPHRQHLAWLDINRNRQDLGRGGAEMASLMWVRDQHMRLSLHCCLTSPASDRLQKPHSLMPPFLSADVHTCCTTLLQHWGLLMLLSAAWCIKRPQRHLRYRQSLIFITFWMFLIELWTFYSSTTWLDTQKWKLQKFKRIS